MSNRNQRDQLIYIFICDYWLEKGYSPSQQEIAVACGIDHIRYVHESLLRLKLKNLIWTETGKVRNIHILNGDLNFVVTRAERPDPETQMLEEILRSLHRLNRKSGQQV